MDKALKQMTKPLEVKNHTEKHKQEKSALLKTPKELKIVYVEESKVKDVTNILEESMQKKGMQKESDTLNSSSSHSQHTLSCTSDSLHRNIVDEDNNDKCFGAKGQISLKWDTASFNEQESEPVKDRKLINQWKVQESQNKYLEDSHFSSTEMKGQAQIKDEILEENIIDDHYQSIPNIQGCLDVIKKENEVTLNVDHESLIKTLEKTNLQKVKSEASEIIFPVDQGEMVIEKLESEEVVGEDRDIIPTAIGDENVKKNYSKVNFTMQKSHENHLEVGGNFKELQNITCLGYLDTLKHEKLDSDKDAVVVKNEMMSVVPQINDADFITEPSDEPNLNLKWTNYVAQSLNSFAHRGTPTNTEQEVKAVGQKEKCRKNSDVTDNSMLVKPLNSLTETSKVSQSVPSNEHRLTESEEIKYQDLESDIKLNAKDTEETQMTQEEKIEQEIERKNRSLDKNNYNSRVLDEEDFKNSEREGSANIQRTAGRLLRKNVKYTEKMKEFMSFVKQEVEEMTAGSASTTSHFKTLSPGGLLKGQARTPVSTGTERKYSAILADTNSKATPRMEENDEFPKLENLENVSYKIPFQYEIFERCAVIHG
ncbi:uncharacterized protein LOC143229643 isoform X2 [Tachypleus tridentatus]|uniref:uncharacterized protein LOC143229643 isoform X2 n=1 Tax=Tachypleus tridentatus TaxID=6853 RepID=UPI003FD4E2C4